MILIEILIPQLGKRLYVRAKRNNYVSDIRGAVSEVVSTLLGENCNRSWKIIDADYLHNVADECSVMEAGLVNGSRLMFVS